MNDYLLSAYQLSKIYHQGENMLKVVDAVNLDIQQGEFLCITGASGAGKSTLLHMLGTLDKPTEGVVRYKGQALAYKNEDELSKFRNEKMGFIFQFHHLLSEFTAEENVMMPLLIRGENRASAREQAVQILGELKLGKRLDHFPSEMSGGEQQRVAIARAMVTRPEILLADEPTGNLDAKNEENIKEILFDLHKKHRLSVVAVSHNPSFAQMFTKRMMMKDGKLYNS